MSASPNPTPPDIKWLANELAATKGEMERIDEELARLEDRRGRLETVYASLAAVSALLQAPGLENAVAAVRAHPSRGGRGSIVNFVRAALQAALPGALDTRSVTELTIERFALQFATPQQRNRFRKATVSHTLQRLVNAGEVERLHDVKTMPNAPGLWRWKVDRPSAVDLQAMDPERADIVGDDPWP
ncbi:MAG: hypothetical protein U1F53_01295 [Burkholderiaceae bacterium]